MTHTKKMSLVRAILNREWNPIGLALADTDDEYDDYAEYIVQRQSWHEQNLVKYLLFIEEQYIGLPVDRERKKIAHEVAVRIMAELAHQG